MEGLLVKLLRIGSNMFNRIKSYLYNRRARVSVDRSHNKKILLKHGAPLGGVLPTTLFPLFINDIMSEVPKGTKAALYADPRKNTQLQSHSECSWLLTCSTAGRGNGALQSTRTSLPPPCSPISQSKKLAPPLLVDSAK